MKLPHRKREPSFTKVLFLAMDAGDKFLLQSWAADGTLPTIGSLLAKGFIGETMSLEGFYEGSTWPSFYTGVTPAHHGFHSLVQLKPGTYEFYRCYPGTFVRREPFWNHLSRAGRRVAILDIPLSGLSKKLNGIQVVEWGSHDGIYGFRTWPPKLKWDISARFGRHPVKNPCDSYGKTPHDVCIFRDRLVEGVRRKADLTIHYLRKGGWDFFAQVFSEIHCVGHQCWHLHDPRHPNHDSETAHLTKNPIREVYKAIDTAIGKILTYVDKDTTVFFLASHRMAHNVCGHFALSEILERLCLMKKLPDGVLNEELRSMVGKLYNVLVRSFHDIPVAIKEPLKPALLRVHEWLMKWLIAKGHFQLPSSVSKIDLNNSKCFPLHNGHPVSGLRINLKGREPNGIIRPGSELNQFCHDTAADLLSIIDCGTGKPLVKSVKKTFELYEGEYIDHLPDLLIEWNDEKMVGSSRVGDMNNGKLQITSKKIGLLEGINRYCRTGDHRPEGLFVLLGPGVQAGRIGSTVSIMDFAPTFAQLFGIQIPNVDGKPIVEILETVRHRQ